MAQQQMKRVIGRVASCPRCGDKVAALVSRTKGTTYYVRIVQEIPDGALCGIADFHNCDTAKRAAYQAAQPQQTYTGIVNLFKTCVEKGAKRLTVTVATSAETRLMVSYNASRGVLYVSNGLSDDANRYYGALNLTDGSLRPGRDRMTPEQTALMIAFNANPVAVAVASARFTGACSFCQRTLTDERSIAVGYGPTCADNYGLPWGVKAA